MRGKINEMVLSELLEYAKRYCTDAPQFIAIQDINESQVKIKGHWQNRPCAWGILHKDHQFIFWETDDERGYVCYQKSFSSEEAACDYAKKEVNNMSEWTTCQKKKLYRL